MVVSGRIRGFFQSRGVVLFSRQFRVKFLVPGNMNTPSIRVDVMRDMSVLDLIAEQYEDLCSRADWINLIFSEWMRAWWKRQKQDRSPLFLLALGPEGSLLGYWPFIERPGLLGTKGLWPFIYDEANYHFPTCENRAPVNWLDICTICLVPFFCLGSSSSRKILG